MLHKRCGAISGLQWSPSSHIVKDASVGDFAVLFVRLSLVDVGTHYLSLVIHGTELFLKVEGKKFLFPMHFWS